MLQKDDDDADDQDISGPGISVTEPSGPHVQNLKLFWIVAIVKAVLL